jgi:hypothetical protein
MFGTKKLIAGVSGGLAGGLVFGMMMAMMGMLPMIGRMVGSPTAAAGWLVHLAISASIGASFAVALGWLAQGRVSSTLFGTIYGAVWWLLGPLTLMPLFMGMGLGVNWNAAAAANMLPSLMGHVIFGVILGFTYDLMQRRFASRAGRRAQEHGAEAEVTVLQG